ncbi:hypothetical protein [Flaviaesturariibacter terrae]
MKLEFLDDISRGGAFPFADPDKLIRLFDFTVPEARALCLAIATKLIEGEQPLQLHELQFIEALNCTLTLAPSNTNLGIALPDDRRNFTCYLTRESYTTMANLVRHFAHAGHALSGSHWLYDPGRGQVDLLLSPSGTW